MKRLIIFGFLTLFSGCSFERVKYFTDPTGKYTISYFPHFIDYTRHIVFTYGKVVDKELPVSYLIIPDKGFDGARCLIKWNYDTAFIYEPYNKFKRVNMDIEKRLQLREIEDSIFTSIYYDTSNNSYIRFGDEYQ